MSRGTAFRSFPSSCARAAVVLSAAPLLPCLAAAPASLGAQDPPPGPLRIVAEPPRVSLEAGSSAPLALRVLDARGGEVEMDVRAAAPRESLRWRGGEVEAYEAGEFEIVFTGVMTSGLEGEPPVLHVPVSVAWPPVERIELQTEPGALYVGTRLGHRARAVHADGSIRPDAEISWTSSDPSVASVDRWGTVTGHAAGSVTIRAAFEDAAAEADYEISAFTPVELRITGGADRARTGDVLDFGVVANGSDGGAVMDLPVTWAYTFVPDDSIHAPGAAAVVAEDGRFVAEVPGRYEVLALTEGLTARRAVEVEPRDVVRKVEMVGHGSVSHVHTSDLWVFEGLDGRDYAVTGTWRGDGWAYFWDVTDPGSPTKTDSIQLDARTVNDVKVSPDGRYAALSREGASDRRNGVVILDLADPADPVVASTWDEGLTGGVHNLFATDEHLFALSAGDKYVILDVSDIYAPTYVSEYDHPDSRIHDVWVHDGIAYSSEWGTGVVVVDVGNGRWGGTVENPVFVTAVSYPVGRTHAAFPYVQESTGKVYLFLGDEILNREGAAFEGYGSDDAWDPETGEGGVQSPTSGYIHIIDFTDPGNPRDVARYEAKEFGTHNFWVEDDILYVAYYEGGLRVVDVSGELMGNLATQGREIAVFKAFDPRGFMANQPNAWGAQPFKDHVFFSDFNSGLWAVRIEPPGRPIS